MPRSLRVSRKWIHKVKIAVRHSGYPTQRALARNTGFALSTVSNFLTGKPVSFSTFEELCHKLNLDWKEIHCRNIDISSNINIEEIIADNSPILLIVIK